MYVMSVWFASLRLKYKDHPEAKQSYFKMPKMITIFANCIQFSGLIVFFVMQLMEYLDDTQLVSTEQTVACLLCFDLLFLWDGIARIHYYFKANHMH